MIGYSKIHYKNGDIEDYFEECYKEEDFIKILEIISKNDDVSFVTYEGFEDE